MSTAPTFSLNVDTKTDFNRLLHCEWIETDGIGGWASSTVSGAHTRRYHGLLVAATQPPVGRVVLLSKLAESLAVQDQLFHLDTNLYPGAVHPEGHHNLTAFCLDPFPRFTYKFGEVELSRELAVLPGGRGTVVHYRLVQAPEPVRLHVRPFFAGRDYHHLRRAFEGTLGRDQFAHNLLQFHFHDDLPSVQLRATGARYQSDPIWYYDFQYPREAERGLDSSEDLFTCGQLTWVLHPGQSVGLVATINEPPSQASEQLLQTESQRRRHTDLPPDLAGDPLARRLATAADAFLVGPDRPSIIAGYHWFTDWGRDTMIALPGLCLVTGRLDQARAILEAYAAHFSGGMIPNRFPDGGGDPEYNTVDATLWFFVALYRYAQYSDDFDLVETLWPPLEQSIDCHLQGTRYGIGVAEDGLLQAGEPATQLTWMDAKIGDWVVTPREGKAVEINALWYNALRIAAALGRRLGKEKPAQAYDQLADRVGAHFATAFWYQEGGYLYDVLGPKGPDASLRPNQLLALSLPFTLLQGERADAVLGQVESQLLTPRGLRSLAPSDPAYRASYQGSPLERDGAYHQGTVWGWLIGPFISALVRQRGAAGQRQARRLVEQFEPHLDEAGLGTVSEIFDAEEPHRPRGCIAQAWSVGELLRSYWEDARGQQPPHTI
ncbi:MAG: glycogen debranching protein [Candidatus Latescibacteria bacterium]|nr:glycogen debranching protein [Candidatus Latescibacterota bacterium]